MYAEGYDVIRKATSTAVPTLKHESYLELTKCNLLFRFDLFIASIVENIYRYMVTSSNGNNVHVTGLCEGNPPVTGGFPSQKPVMRSFFGGRLNKPLSKQSIDRWFVTPWLSLWRHCNDFRKHDLWGYPVGVVDIFISDILKHWYHSKRNKNVYSEDNVYYFWHKTTYSLT